MEMISNETFRLVGPETTYKDFDPGIYRIIINSFARGLIACSLIANENSETSKTRAEKRKRKKSPLPLVGKLRWIPKKVFASLVEQGQIIPIQYQRNSTDAKSLSPKALSVYSRRVQVMGDFLDQIRLHDELEATCSISSLVKHAMNKFSVSKFYVHKNWSLLCRYGLTAPSLSPSLKNCGGRGIPRPCDVNPDGSLMRQKPGRKRKVQSMQKTLGHEFVLQPGITSEWRKMILSLDSKFKNPKPSYPVRCKHILEMGFSDVADVNGQIVKTLRPRGQYPSRAQILHVLKSGTSSMQRIGETTSKRHLESSRRGLTAKGWQGVPGPGHTWAIDSTIGDIYLRSSVNRDWIIGRPIVYLIVDMWSTAIVGGHICLEGPSWKTAKLAIFNAVCDPASLGELWGQDPLESLNPRPMLPAALLCDRGEYLSEKHKETAIKLFPHTSYTPPYRGDLKGLVEVLHRIEKDKMFRFVPGALDARRDEMDLRKSKPQESALTLNEFWAYLQHSIHEYNLTADRSNRLDASMLADGVDPSPAGLWNWGHSVGIGYRKAVPADEINRSLLQPVRASIQRDGLTYLNCNYSSPKIDLKEFTTIARNRGLIEINAYHYPGSMQSLWIPDNESDDLIRCTITDTSLSLPTITADEWLDCVAVRAATKSIHEHKHNEISVQTYAQQKSIISESKKSTRKMNKVKNDPIPNISAARKIEIESTKLKPELNSIGVRPKETVTSNISQPSRDLEDSYALLMHRLTGKNKGSDV
jgi:putative transposase